MKSCHDAVGKLLNQSTTLNDPLGRMLSRTDKLLGTNEDVAYQYGYSNLYDGGQMMTITDPLNRISRVSKDKEGRVFKGEDAAGNTIDYFYEDGRGSLTGSIDAEGHAISYEYDANGRRVKTIRELENSEKQITQFAYDAGNNLVSIKDAHVGGRSRHPEHS